MADRYSRGIQVPDAQLLVDCPFDSFSPEAYRAQPDQVGDKICIFGFSRGAYTARALAGMLQKVGLLPSSKGDKLQSAYAMYERDDEEGRKLSAQFKQTSIDVRVKFLGVWYVIRPPDLLPISHFHTGTLWNPSG